MREIETDYLVVGAGASGMAFVDALIAASDADVVMVDRRHRPGGHWIDAYPFVRLHQPSANYGVNSRVLGSDRIDDVGPNAGFYERASAAEVCEYYDKVLEDHLLRSGQVRFFGMCDYRGNGSDGHQVVSILTGEPTTVKVRRKLIDATYLETSIPSKHTPGFEVDEGVRLIPPNALVHSSEPATGYTVLGAGKTAMDTCTWLIDQGVDPDRIRWVKPRDSWAMDRASSQPLALVGDFMELQSRFIEAAAEADSGADFAHRLEAHGIFVRVDLEVEPEVFRGAILSAGEVATLRQVTNVIRQGKVRRISTDRVTMTEGTVASDAGQVYVDCTAAGLRVVPTRPIFESGRVTVQMVTLGIVPWTAATLGYVEASRDDDEEKNRLCPPLPFTGEVPDLLRPMSRAMRGLTARMAEPDLSEWNENSRLNPGRGAMASMDDPKLQAAFGRMVTNIEAAIANSERLAGASAASPVHPRPRPRSLRRRYARPRVNPPDGDRPGCPVDGCARGRAASCDG